MEKKINYKPRAELEFNLNFKKTILDQVIKNKGFDTELVSFFNDLLKKYDVKVIEKSLTVATFKKAINDLQYKFNKINNERN